MIHKINDIDIKDINKKHLIIILLFFYFTFQ